MTASTAPVPVIHPYIECRPDVQGGRPFIRGTRFPVSSVIQNHRRGLSAEEILRDFPALNEAQLYDALSYYYDHREAIDKEITAMSDVQEAMHQFPPTLTR